LDSYDYMMSSGDTSVWEDSVDPECQVCGRFLDNAQVLDEQGGYLVGGAFDVHSTTFSGNGEPPATGTVVAEFTQEESILVDDPQLQANQLGSVTGQLIAAVAWDGERWRGTDMSIAPPEGEAPSDGGGGGDAGGVPVPDVCGCRSRARTPSFHALPPPALRSDGSSPRSSGG